jgi:hypothetical protein
LSTAMMALVPSTFSFQPEMLPSSPEKMNVAGAGWPLPSWIWKPCPPLKTCPVGLPTAPPPPGTLTTRPWLAPVPS